MSRVSPKQQHGGLKKLKTTRMLHNTCYKHDTSYTGPQTCAMVATDYSKKTHKILWEDPPNAQGDRDKISFTGLHLKILARKI